MPRRLSAPPDQGSLLSLVRCALRQKEIRVEQDPARLIEPRRMDELRFPTVTGAIEVAEHLGVDSDAIDFTCQDWEYTYPELQQLPEFIRIYTTCNLSDHAKRVLGCFIFQTLNDHLRSGGAEILVHDTLRELKRDYRIHEPEFRYWALSDLDNDEEGATDNGFHLTRFAMEYVA